MILLMFYIVWFGWKMGIAWMLQKRTHILLRLQKGASINLSREFSFEPHERKKKRSKIFLHSNRFFYSSFQSRLFDNKSSRFYWNYIFIECTRTRGMYMLANEGIIKPVIIINLFNPQLSIFFRFNSWCACRGISSVS